MEENGTKARPKIVFGLQAAQKDSSEPSVLEQTRDRHRQRAERFKTDYVPPEKISYQLHHEARKERLAEQRKGFVTGIDPFSQDEVHRRRQRAERFGGHDAPELQEMLAEKAEEEKRRKARADKFQTEYKPPTEQVLMDVDVLEGRKDVAVEVERRLDTVHLFGVDLMSTGDVLKYFSDYGPKYVEWINDSSCPALLPDAQQRGNVLFADGNTVKRVLVGMGTPLPSDEQMQALDMDDINSAIYLWYKGQDFEKGGTAVPLLYRVATVEDAKPPPSSEHVTRGLWKAGHEQGRGRGRGKRQRHDANAMQTDELDGQEQGKGRRRRRRRVTKQRQLANGDWVEDVEMVDIEDNDEGPEGNQEGTEPYHDQQAGEDDRQLDNDERFAGRFRADVYGGRAITVDDLRAHSELQDDGAAADDEGGGDDATSL